MVPWSRNVHPIPPETYQAARQVYHLDHVYLLIGDRLDDILRDIALTSLDPRAGLGSVLASRLGLVTAFQYAERIPDDAAAQATLQRTDWKYALHLPIKHPGYSAGALCSFRECSLESRLALDELQRLVEILGSFGLYSKKVLKNIDAEQVLCSICLITRLSQIVSAMKSMLSVLVTQNADWLRDNASAEWYTRYRTGSLGRYSEWNDEQIIAEIEAVERDSRSLLDKLARHDGPTLLHQPEIQHLTCLVKGSGLQADPTGAMQIGCANCANRRM